MSPSFINNLQNTAVIETQWLNNLTAKINAIDLCADLQAVINEVFAYIQARINQLEASIEALAIVELLLSIPDSLDAIITWIGNLITLVIKPYYQQYLTAIAQLIALADAITSLTAAIEAAAERIGSCTPTIPTISITIPTPFPPP